MHLKLPVAVRTSTFLKIHRLWMTTKPFWKINKIVLFIEDYNNSSVTSAHLNYTNQFFFSPATLFPAPQPCIFPRFASRSFRSSVGVRTGVARRKPRDPLAAPHWEARITLTSLHRRGWYICTWILCWSCNCGILKLEEGLDIQNWPSEPWKDAMRKQLLPTKTNTEPWFAPNVTHRPFWHTSKKNNKQNNSNKLRVEGRRWAK